MWEKLHSHRCPIHNDPLLSSDWTGNLGVQVRNCCSCRGCVRNAGELLQLMEHLSTLPYISLFWLQLYPIVIMLITVMPWLIMDFDVGLTDDGPWHGFPRIQMVFVQWGCPGLFLPSSPGCSLAGGVWEGSQAQSSRAGPTLEPKWAKVGDAQTLRDCGGTVSASPWICQIGQQACKKGQHLKYLSCFKAPETQNSNFKNAELKLWLE